MEGEKKKWLPPVEFVAFVLCAGLASAGVNLVPDGDLTDGKFPSFSSDGSKISCVTEDVTWNKCLKLEVGASSTNAEGTVVSLAALYVGKDGKHVGFPARPNTTYDFSLELKGGVDRAYIAAYEWTGDDRWKDLRELKTKPVLKGADMGGVPVGDTWTRYKGSFTTSAQAKRAMVEVKLWRSSRYRQPLFKPGSYLLVDGVSVAESEQNLDAAPDSIQAPWTKAIASGDGVITDFVDFYTQKPLVGNTSLKITTKGKAFVFDFTCDDEQDGFTLPKAGESIWEGDACEVWFGPVGKERLTSQFAVGLSGEKYAAVNGARVDPSCFEVKSERTDRQWKVRLTVPFAAFGRPDFKPGDDIAFNASRTRQKGGGDPTWCGVKGKMSETATYGRLFYDRYPLGCATRAEYEKKRNEAEKAALRAKFERFRSQKLAVAPVPVTCDFEVPFLPKEIFDAPERIRVKAAVNEWKSVPIAVANLSSREGDYIVVLDHQRPFHKDPAKYNPNATDFGLKGFPAEKMRVRRALKMRDSDARDPSLRFDPLPYADQISSLTVAPKEAGVMWFEFDTHGVKPGVYAGDLRVIPLCEYGKFTRGKGGFHDLQYEGEMRVVPFQLEILPIVLAERAVRPGLLDSHGVSDEGYQLQTELGVTDFTITPWWFTYGRDAQGNLDYTKPSEDCLHAQERIRQHLAWGRKFDNPPHFVVCFNTAPAFRQMLNPTKDPAEDERLWPQFLKGMRLAMEACGVPPEQWEVEIYDEPPKGISAEILRMSRIAKEHEPTVRLQIALGLHGMTTNELAAIGRYVDCWTPSDASNWPNPAYVAFLRSELEKGKRVGHYVCYTGMRLSLNSYYRRHSWLGEKYQTSLDGLFWFHVDCGPTGTRDFKSTAEGAVAYTMFGKVVPTVRYMAMREGVMDIKYIAKLRELAPDDPKVRKFIDESIENVTSRLAHDPAEPDRVREEATKLILELQAKKRGGR